MEKEAMDNAKRTFFNTLARNGITPAAYLETPQGISILKYASACARDTSTEKRAAFWDVADAVMKNENLRNAALGVIGGYGTGAALGKLTSPTSVSIGNLQKQEMIAELDTAIEELKNRMAVRAAQAV